MAKENTGSRGNRKEVKIDTYDREKMLAERDALAEKEQKAEEKHLYTKITINASDFNEIYSDNFRDIPDGEDIMVDIELQEFTDLFRELSDNARLELIKSLIWTGDQEKMLNKVTKLVKSDKFKETID